MCGRNIGMVLNTCVVLFVCVDLTCQIWQNKTGKTFKADGIFWQKSPLGCLCDLFMLFSIFKYGQYLSEKNQMGWLSNRLQDCKVTTPTRDAGMDFYRASSPENSTNSNVLRSGTLSSAARECHSLNWERSRSATPFYQKERCGSGPHIYEVSAIMSGPLLSLFFSDVLSHFCVVNIFQKRLRAYI